MQPLEKFEMMEDSPEETRDPLAQLSFAYKRSEAELAGGIQEALSEGIRRAEAVLFAAGEPLSAEQIAEILPHGVESGEVLMALRAQYANRGVNLVESPLSGVSRRPPTLLTCLLKSARSRRSSDRLRSRRWLSSPMASR